MENILRYDCIMIVVSEVLTADSNSNNGWIGGTDASTEVSQDVSLGTMIHDNDVQGTWTWSDATQFSFANWWTGQFSLTIYGSCLHNFQINCSICIQEGEGSQQGELCRTACR